MITGPLEVFLLKIRRVWCRIDQTFNDFSKIIDKEQSLLDVMRGQVVVVNLQDDNDEDDGNYKNNWTLPYEISMWSPHGTIS
mgnify:CR=1 FL=1